MKTCVVSVCNCSLPYDLNAPQCLLFPQSTAAQAFAHGSAELVRRCSERARCQRLRIGAARRRSGQLGVSVDIILTPTDRLEKLFLLKNARMWLLNFPAFGCSFKKEKDKEMFLREGPCSRWSWFGHIVWSSSVSSLRITPGPGGAVPSWPRRPQPPSYFGF